MFSQRVTGHRKIMLLITDGVPTLGHSPCDAGNFGILNEIQQQAITVIIVGIGNFDYSQISCLTTHSDYVVHVKDFQQLDDIEEKIHKLYCNDNPGNLLNFCFRNEILKSNRAKMKRNKDLLFSLDNL